MQLNKKQMLYVCLLRHFNSVFFYSKSGSINLGKLVYEIVIHEEEKKLEKLTETHYFKIRKLVDKMPRDSYTIHTIHIQSVLIKL